MQKNWYFEPHSPMGGATGEAFTNTLQGSGMPTESVLAREVIQNSCDAWYSASDAKVKVVFRIKSLFGDEKRIFLDSLGISNDFHPRKKSLGLYSHNCLSYIDDDHHPLRLLYVEDYQTVGLKGDPHNSDSNFHRLLLALGDGSKAHEKTGTGGSYGFGKSVYSSNSKIHTIVAHSAFESDSAPGTFTTRLMGCAYFPSHEFNGKRFSGRAWLGREKNHQDGFKIVDPFEGEEAHLIADSLGFSPRKKEGSFGTTILLIDCSIEVDKLRSGIEDWWWPRLIEDNLDVEIWEDGTRLPPPRPRSRKDIQPFIEAFDLAVNKSQPLGKHQKTDKFNKVDGHALGAYGFQLLSTNGDADDVPEDRKNTIALIREPRMVVSYMQLGRDIPAAVGTFVADPDVDSFLRYSEPATHDKWDPDSSRLGHVENEELARNCVRSILERLKLRLRKFQTEAIPAKQKVEKRLNFLEKELGNLFRPPTRGPKPPTDIDVDPIEIKFFKSPSATQQGNSLITTAGFSVRLRDDADEQEVKLKLKVNIPVLEDDGNVEGDELPLKLEAENVEVVPEPNSNGIVRFLLAKGVTAKFDVSSSEYDPTWSTKVTVEVSKEGTDQ